MKYVLRLIYRIPKQVYIPGNTLLIRIYCPAVPYICAQSRFCGTMGDNQQKPRADRKTGVDGKIGSEKGKKVKKEKKNDAASLEVRQFCREQWV